ncbi:hypothetical protein SSYIS1_04610 [Serratia symbiotica]|uniref:Uncharacterized protein n=1 Tax=Serratia symbiotica TaxID=138074 RepID=A0A455VQI8_9GAMM|nr:hypothetical protein SSYIS1_04610 [Serratia symbiotica]
MHLRRHTRHDYAVDIAVKRAADATLLTVYSSPHSMPKCR